MNGQRYEYKGWTIMVFYTNPGFGWTGEARKGHLTLTTSEAGSERHAVSRLKRQIDSGGPYKV